MKSVIQNQKYVLTFAFLTILSFGCIAQPKGETIYLKNCAQCHGSDLNGGNATSLIDGVWQYGDEDGYISRNIKFGIPNLGMPSYEETLSDSDIRALVQYIRESENKVGATPPPIPEKIETMDYDINVEIFVEGLEIPWAIDFIDKNTALITERPGRLRIVKNGILQDEPVQNIPEVLNEGQGGLLDVAIDPEYNENGWIYLAYSHALKSQNGDRPLAMTRIVRGKIENNTWTNQEVLFEAPHENYRPTRHHYGCRIVFDPWGYLYFSIGERGYGFEAQDVSLVNGKVHRINKDGSIPESNPFNFNDSAGKTIYSYGNRNIQGMAIHPVTGQLWATEHGPMGGDELNLILPGRNYGWETITYGKNYNGTIITEETHRPGMEQPVLYWKPSIAVCGLDFYCSSLFKKWENKLLVGALKYEEVRLLDIEEDRVMHDQIIFKGYGRVRDVSTGPDGAIYIVLNDPGTVVRLTPDKN
ncbi:MAG: PQQ-dependent sugar dehydrogenase [Prolixibacteraceae bacterium]|nr:PQQ-dependent sugar dehydrogenase [Prolixibacteraceae bacterium]MBN2774411.1 PQQ-dependent sugar dehydrogenase [Prolixibacteraceae bacterium]